MIEENRTIRLGEEEQNMKKRLRTGLQVIGGSLFVSGLHITSRGQWSGLVLSVLGICLVWLGAELPPDL
jgi:hypothetical protein